MKIKKILLVTHQLDFSGAPLALLQLAKLLCQLQWKVDLFSIGGEGALMGDFVNLGANYLNKKSFFDIEKNDYDLILFNTVVTSSLIPEEKLRKTKLVLWIHESPFLAGFAWSPSVNLTKSFNLDLIIFPTFSCKNEWEGLIDTSKAVTLLSPVELPKIYPVLAKENNVKTFCIIDPREAYRNIHRIEEAMLKYQGMAIFNYVGATPPADAVLDILDKKGNIQANYYGRVSREKALEVLSNSDIYISATCLATQNRGMCEAIVLNKKIYASRIKAHIEIAKMAGITSQSLFFALDSLDLNQNFSIPNYSSDFLSPNKFADNLINIFQRLNF